MARPIRQDPDMGIHHIYTRGTKRWLLFHDDSDRRHFMGTFSRVCDRYCVDALAFCLMDNHFHLVLQFPQGQISEALRDLKSIFARSFNRRHRSSGPIFEDRFGSQLVTSYQQLRTLVRYVHRNPYSIDAAMNLASYPWSSHPMYLGARPSPVWLDTSWITLFNDYRVDVERPLAADKVQNTWNAERALVREPASGHVPGTCPLATASLVDVLMAVVHAAGCVRADVHPNRRNGLIGLAVLIAFEDLGFSPSEIAQPFGYKTAGAVQSALRRTRKRLTEEASSQQLLLDARCRLAGPSS